jgi:hypothetical protein
MQFHIFKCSLSDVYGVTDQPDPSVLPADACPGGTWEPFKVVAETGRPRIALDEQAAKADIDKQGYHLLRAGIGADKP